jgi:hypothetical protein
MAILLGRGWAQALGARNFLAIFLSRQQRSRIFTQFLRRPRGASERRVLGVPRPSIVQNAKYLPHGASHLAGCERLYSEKMSGAYSDRPWQTKAIAALGEGDTRRRPLAREHHASGHELSWRYVSLAIARDNTQHEPYRPSANKRDAGNPI